MSEINIVLTAIYRYMNFPVRIMHRLLENVEGVKPHSVFYKHFEANMGKAPTEKEEELFIRQITDLNPKLVGFSVLSPYMPIARRLTKLVKDNTGALVIWGGVHPTISPQTCINEADMICVGEGEGAILELAECLRDGKDYRQIKNLWINDNGRIIENPLRPLIQDLDSLPNLSYGNSSFYFIDSNKLIREDPLLKGNYLWVQTSRGCPFICSYCVNSLLQPIFRGIGPYSRRRSVESVLSEIKEALALPTAMNYVYFIDEVFGSDRLWLDEFESRYKKEVGLPFTVEYHPKMVNPEMLDKLISSGLDTIKIGIQAGSDRIRNNIYQRPGANKDIIELSRRIAGRGVAIKHDLIMNNPYDTEDSLKEGIELLLQLPKPLLFNLYSLQYFPGYPLTERAINDGYLAREEVTIDKLMETNFKDWSFTPRLFPYDKRQMLQNVIWLIAWGHAKDSIARRGVFGNSLLSKICLNYMNFKAFVLGKITGIGGIAWKHIWLLYIINGLKHILRGDIRTLCCKVKKHLSSNNKNKGGL